MLHAFTGGADGALPSAGLTGDNSGSLYGTTSEGGNGCEGSVGCGTVFKLEPSGNETVLHSFTGEKDGALPAADLVLDGAGDLYGTTQGGGTSNKGGVFKLGGGVAPDFSLAAAAVIVNVNTGGKAGDTVTVAPQNGFFGNAIQLTCAVAGPAPMPTCVLFPTSVTPGADPVTSTLTVTAPAAAATQLRSSRPQLSLALFAMAFPLMFGIAVVGGSKTRRRHRLFNGLLFVGLALQIACGSSVMRSSKEIPPPTNYTVTVAGSSGAIQHTTEVTLTVQ